MRPDGSSSGGTPAPPINVETLIAQGEYQNFLTLQAIVVSG